VGPPYCRAKMYAGRIACCPLVSHGKYAPTGQTDARPMHIGFLLDRGCRLLHASWLAYLVHVGLSQSVEHSGVRLSLLQPLFTNSVAGDDQLLAGRLVLRVNLQNCTEVGHCTIVFLQSVVGLQANQKSKPGTVNRCVTLCQESQA